MIYKRQIQQQDIDIWGAYMLDQYAKFVKNAAELKPQLSSKILRTFYQSIESEKVSEDFIKLCESLKTVKAQYDCIRNMRIYAGFFNAMITDYKIEPGAYEDITETLDKLLSAMGVDAAHRQSSYIQSGDLDLYGKYLNLMVGRTPALKETVKMINVAYDSTVKAIAETDIEDVQFALDCCEFYDIMKEKGIAVCFPEISDSEEIDLEDAGDITLLLQNIKIVPNDLMLSPKEQLIFISGANGGGKTSFMRAIGICCLLGSVGLFIPSREGRMPLVNNIFTLFPRREELVQEGRFHTEKEMAETVSACTGDRDMILANELFSGTNEKKALISYKVYAEQIGKRGTRAFFVTHFPEVIKHFTEEGFSVFTCQTEAGEVTFKIIRSGGYSSSVLQILRKYGLDKEGLRNGFGGGGHD